MTKEDYEIEKLKVEISILKKPFLKKPTSISVLISAATVIVTAIIGFKTYFTEVNTENIAEIKRLENVVKINENLKNEIIYQKSQLSQKQVELEADYYQRKYEDYKVKTDNQKEELLKVKHETDIFKDRMMTVIKESENYVSSEYLPGFMSGILANETNKKELLNYASEDNVEDLEKFIKWLIERTYVNANKKRQEKLNKHLEEIIKGYNNKYYLLGE